MTINNDQVFYLFTFRQQIDKYRREAEDCKNRLYEYEADAQRIQQETVLENEKVACPLICLEKEASIVFQPGLGSSLAVAGVFFVC